MIIQNIIEICVAIDIAILGIAYPIIIDKISNIGDKYSSEYISILFNMEFPQKKLKPILFNFEYSILKLALFSTLLSFVFLILRFPPLFDWNNWFINNSAELIVFCCSLFLIIVFFIWLEKVALYNGSIKTLLKHLINRYNKTKDKTYHLKAINEVALYAIKKQDEHLEKTLLEFYYSIFSSIRQNHNKSTPLVYPDELYTFINKLTLYFKQNETTLKAIEHRAITGQWLLGEATNNIIISTETYQCLWRNIYIICDVPRLIKIYWANSYQYFNYNLKPIDAEYQKGTVINQTEVDRREKERYKFLEVHYALGGLMLYMNQYKTLKYMFEYSQSIPEDYVLLPQKIEDIFHWLESFTNEFKHKIPIMITFYFPDLDNLGNKTQINDWICRYIAILFIRQYNLDKQNIHQPSLPNDILELDNWLSNASILKKHLNNILSNKTLILDLGYEDFIENIGLVFDNFINTLILNIETKINHQKLNAELSKEKINRFYKQSNKIISSSFAKYQNIWNTQAIDKTDNTLKLYLNGVNALMSKSAFTNNDIPTIGYDSVVAEAIAKQKIEYIIPNSFFEAKTKRYLFNLNNIILALNKIINKNKDIKIIGVNIKDQLRGIIKDSNIEFQQIPSTNNQIQNTLFILYKDDLPTIEHKPIKEKSQLQLINAKLNLYASVIDLNKETDNEVRVDWHSNNEDLKVQLTIAFISVIYWKEKRELIQIDIASEYKELGIQNDLNDIIPLYRES